MFKKKVFKKVLFKKVIAGMLGLIMGLVVMVGAEQPLQNFQIQIATSVYHGFDEAQPLVTAPCRVYKIVIANPGATQQLISLYDGDNVIANIDSDDVENVVLNFDEPLQFYTNFGVISGTQTASSYISVQYRLGITGGTDGSQPYRVYSQHLTSGTITAYTGGIEIGKIIISVQTAGTITLTDGSTAKMEIYCPTTSVTQISAYDAPIQFNTSLKVKSSASAETDSYIVIHYRLNPVK